MAPAAIHLVFGATRPLPPAAAHALTVRGHTWIVGETSKGTQQPAVSELSLPNIRGVDVICTAGRAAATTGKYCRLPKSVYWP